MGNVAVRSSLSSVLHSEIEEHNWEKVAARLRYKVGLKEAKKWYEVRQPNGQISHRSLPLHAASRNDAPVEIVQALIRAFPDSTRCSDLDGMLPLHWACYARAHRDHIKALLEARPNTTKMVDSFGRLPLHICCEYGVKSENMSIVYLLRKMYPGSINIRDARGRTPIDIINATGDAPHSNQRDRIFPVRRSLAGSVTSRSTRSGGPQDAGSVGTPLGSERQVLLDPIKEKMLQALKRDSIVSRRSTSSTQSLKSDDFNFMPEVQRIAMRASLRASIRESYQERMNDRENDILPPSSSVDRKSISTTEILGETKYYTADDGIERTLPKRLRRPYTLNDDDESLSTTPADQRFDPQMSFGDHSYSIVESGTSNIQQIYDGFEGNNDHTVDNGNYDEAGTLHQLIHDEKWDEAIQRVKKHPSEARIWLNYGSDQILQENSFSLPIHSAVTHKSCPAKLVKAICEAHTVSPEVKDTWRRIALHLACEYSSEEVVDCLLKLNPLSIFEKDLNGRTPLDCAEGRDDEEKDVIIASLLMEGVQVNSLAVASSTAGEESVIDNQTLTPSEVTEKASRSRSLQLERSISSGVEEQELGSSSGPLSTSMNNHMSATSRIPSQEHSTRAMKIQNKANAPPNLSPGAQWINSVNSGNDNFSIPAADSVAKSNTDDSSKFLFPTRRDTAELGRVGTRSTATDQSSSKSGGSFSQQRRPNLSKMDMTDINVKSKRGSSITTTYTAAQMFARGQGGLPPRDKRGSRVSRLGSGLISISEVAAIQQAAAPSTPTNQGNGSILSYTSAIARKIFPNRGNNFEEDRPEADSNYVESVYATKIFDDTGSSDTASSTDGIVYAQAVPIDVDGNSCLTNKMWNFAIGIFLVIAGMSATSLAISFLSKPVKIPNYSKAPSFAPSTAMPSTFPSMIPSKLTTVSIKEYLIKEGVTNTTALADTSSPQYQAFRWISRYDEFGANTDSYNLVQRYALATFYYATGGYDWSYDYNFLNETHECNWYGNRDDWGGLNKNWGINCNANREVTTISVGLNNLVGTLPNELFHISSLEELVVNDNKLKSTLPSSVGNLQKLTKLELEGNQLSGTLPTELGGLSSLQTLWMFHNSFVGEMPSNVCSEFDATGVEVWADCNDQFTCSCCFVCYD